MNGEEECAAVLMHPNLIFVVLSPIAIVFTKMSFYHSELQKCHF